MKTFLRGWIKRLIPVGVMAIVIASSTSVQAGLQIPYTNDVHTLHLWHFDAASTNLDGSTNILVPDAVAESAITLTNLGQPLPVFPPYTNTSLGNESFTEMGSAMRTTDRFGMCYGGIFPDVSQFCNANSGAFTFEAIVKFANNPLALPNNMAVVYGDQPSQDINVRGWQFRVNNAGQLEWNLLAGSGSDNKFTPGLPNSGDNAAVANQWYHVAVTFTGNAPTNGDNPGELKLYWTLLDPNRTNANLLGAFNMTRPLGGSSGTAQPGFGVGGSGRKVTAGGNGVANGEGFIGWIDEVRISSVARSSNDMAFVTGGAQNLPSIDVEPRSSTLIGYGKTLSLATLATGSLPMTYQWQATNSTSGGFTNVPEQTANTLLISNINFGAAGLYRLFVTNAYGKATSAVAQVTVGAAFSELYNTGVDNDGALTPLAGSADLHYRLIESADVNRLGPDALVWDMFAYPIASYNGNFSNPNDHSKWIGPQANNYSSPVGRYVYRIAFVIDSTDLSQPAALQGLWYANEYGDDILLNGQSTGNTLPAGISSAGKFPAEFVITSGLVPGLNTLDFVTTRSASANGAYQESALRVELSGVGLALSPGKPVITNQPASVTVRENGKASFSVVALGRPPLSYQWWANSALLTDATNRTLSFNSVFTGGQGTNFQVVISNDSGSVTSQVAGLTLTTNRPPVAPVINVTTLPNTPLNVSIATLIYGSTDADLDAITLYNYDGNSTNGGSVIQDAVNTINLVYTPVTDFVGADQFSFTVSDDQGALGFGFVNISVAAVVQQPVTTRVFISGSNVIFSGTNAPTSGSYVVLSSTSVTTPLSSWVREATNAWNGSGTFSVTNALTPGTPQKFYMLQSQ